MLLRWSCFSNLIWCAFSFVERWDVSFERTFMLTNWVCLRCSSLSFQIPTWHECLLWEWMSRTQPWVTIILPNLRTLEAFGLIPSLGWMGLFSCSWWIWFWLHTHLFLWDTSDQPTCHERGLWAVDQTWISVSSHVLIVPTIPLANFLHQQIGCWWIYTTDCMGGIA